LTQRIDGVLSAENAGSAARGSRETMMDANALDWWLRAIPASDAVYKLVDTWPDFDACAPTPKPTLRIVPRT
jgi:hypothetical protein